jgi:hypothetical protein
MKDSVFCNSWIRRVEKRHFLRNGLLEAMRNHQRPLLVNGCIDTFL